MDELTIGDKTYISTKRAAALTGYAKDYIGQLCREGRVEAKLVGRSWYVREESLRGHRFGPETPESSTPVTIEDRAARFMGVTYTPEPAPMLPEVVKHEPIVPVVEKSAQETKAHSIPTGDVPTRIPISHLKANAAPVRAMDVLTVSSRQPIKRTEPNSRQGRTREEKPRSYLVVRAIMGAVILLVVSVAVLGSGSLDQTNHSDTENSFISFIRGVKIYDRSK